MGSLSAMALPLLVGLILVYGFLKGVNVFDCFVAGAKEGIRATVSVLPTLVGLMMTVSVLRASGLLEAVSWLLHPAADLLGISPEILPLALLRPISGSGSMAYARDLMVRFGPDSPTGRLAAVLATSTETSFYAIAVYFGSAPYKKLYHTVPVALLGDLMTLLLAVLSLRLF